MTTCFTLLTLLSDVPGICHFCTCYARRNIVLCISTLVNHTGFSIIFLVSCLTLVGMVTGDVSACLLLGSSVRPLPVSSSCPWSQAVEPWPAASPSSESQTPGVSPGLRLAASLRQLRLPWLLSSPSSQNEQVETRSSQDTTTSIC